MIFTFFSPVQIIFGQKQSKQLHSKFSESGKNALVITGKNQKRAEYILHSLESEGIKYECLSQKGEPLIQDVSAAVEMARSSGTDFIIAQGGGSVIDAGKAIAALVNNRGKVTDYLEIIGKGLPLTGKPVPMIAIPTTSGTGAEVTCNAVLKSLDKGVKVSMRSRFMYPDIAVVDPALSITMPPEITASTGMDALTQLIEAFTTPFATPFTDALCREGITRAARSFLRAFHHGDDIDARADMSIASLFSGISLANAKLGAVHGIAGPMGGMINASHGAICARLLAPVTALNIKLLEKRAPESPILEKYRETASLLTGDKGASLNSGIRWITDLTRKMNIPGLGALGIKDSNRDHIEQIARNAQNSSSMKGNPVEYTQKETADLIKSAISNP